MGLDLEILIRYTAYMERERTSPPPKLTEIARRDFPGAREVLLSFADQWEFLDVVERDSAPLYVAGFPIERAFNGREHFEGLPAEINVNLVFYRLYKFFQPWPLPQVTVAWDERKGEGRVVEDRGYNLQLQPVGQAQAWFGLTHAVIWECYFERTGRAGNWETTLAEIWKLVEKDVRAPKIFTLPHEPAFEGNYRFYLQQLGYAVDAETQGWWSKTLTPDSKE